MGNRYILVLDAGTTGPRCLVFDDGAQVAGFCARQWSYAREEGASSLARAFEPQVLWRGFCQLIADSLKEAHAQPRQLAAVSITSQRQGVVFLDDAGRELYAGPNLDLRAVFEGAAIDEEMRDRVYQTTGHLPSFFFAPARLRWFQLHRPDEYGRIASILTLADWLGWRLTGVQASEPTLAGEAGLLDIHRRDWCKTLMRNMGLMSNTIPLVDTGTVLGHVSSQSAEETGLATGIPVVVGGADTQCGLLGMGVAQERQVGIVAGWSAPLQMVTTKPVLSPEARTWAGCFLERDKWVLESSPGDVGNSYQWLANTMFASAPDAFGKMDALASAAHPGSEGALALLGPSRMDMAKVGMRLGGLLFPVPLTFSDLGQGHLVRSALEAAAFAIRANLEQIERLSHAPASDIAVGGGMTRTPAFVRILTDVIGREVKFSPIPQVSALGAYLCARVALGDHGSLHEAAASVRPYLQALEPGPADSAEYEDLYQRWAELSQELGRLSV